MAVTFGVYSVITDSPILQPDFSADYSLLCSFPSKMDTYGNVFEDSKYLNLVLLPYSRKYAQVRGHIMQLFRAYGCGAINHIYCFSEVD